MAATAASFYDRELERDDLAALMAGNEVSINEIVEGLYHGQAVVRRNAALGASLVSDLPDPGRALLRMSAKDSDERVRMAIVLAMGQGGYPVGLALPILFDALRDPLDDIADTALQGIELRLTRDREAALPLVAGGLRGPHPVTAKGCADVLIKAGDSCVDAVVPLLGDGDAAVRRAAYDVLERLRRGAVMQLIAALRDETARPLAARLIGGIGELPAPAVTALEALAADPDPALAETAGRALLALRSPKAPPPRTEPLDVPIDGFETGPLDGAALDAAASAAVPRDELLYALRDGRDHVRRNAVGVLGRRPDAKEAAAATLGALAPLLKDPSAPVRRATCEAIARVDGTGAIGLLVRALGDTDPEVAQAAHDGLAAGGIDCAPQLLEALSGELPEAAQDAAVELLARHGAAATTALADALSESPASTVRLVAARALGAIGKAAEEGIAALLRGLDDRASASVRIASAHALGFVGVEDDTILGALRQALNDPIPSVRRASAIAASRIAGRPLDDRGALEPAPIPIEGFETQILSAEAITAARGEIQLAAFIAKLKDGRDVVRTNAATAIRTFGAGAGAAAEPLAALLRDGDAGVRHAVLEAFRALGPAAEPAAYWLLATPADPSPACAELGVEVLAGLHAIIGDFLVEALRVDPTVAEGSIHRVFARLEAKGVPILQAALKNGSALIRLNAARALEIVARKGGDAALGDLEARLADPVGDVRKAASAAIDAIKGGIPKPPKVLEPEPVDIPGFLDGVLPAKTLAGQTKQTSVERMIRALRDGRSYVRENAATLLGHYGPKGAAAIGPLAVALKDGVVAVRCAAATALGQLGAAAPGPAPEILVSALADPAPAVSAAATDALVSLGEAALGALVGGLSRPVDVAAKTVLPILAKHGEAARQRLGDALADPSPVVRAAAARGLLMLGREVAETSRPEVDQALRDSDTTVRAEARRVMDHLDRKDEQPKALEPAPIPIAGFEEAPLTVEAIAAARGDVPLDAFVQKLRDGRAIVRANAARGVATFGPDAAEASEWLAVLLKDEEVAVKRAAVEALGALGPAAAPAAAHLVAALGDEDEAVSGGAVEILTALHGAIGEALTEGLRVDVDLGSRTIQRVFVKLEGDGVDLLKAALKSGSGLIRVNAARTLEAIAKKGGGGAQKQLEDALADPVRMVRTAARAALDAIVGAKPKAPVALEPLPLPHEHFAKTLLSAEVLAGIAGEIELGRMCHALYDGRWVVRANAAQALAVIDAKQADGARPHLVMALKDERADVRRRAAQALGAMGVSRDEAFDLVIALDDPSPLVVEAVEEALGAAGDQAIEAFLYALDNLPSLVARSALPMLARLEKRAVDPLVAALSHDAAQVRQNALIGLRLLAPKIARGARAAVSLARFDAVRDVRLETFRTLDYIDEVPTRPLVREPLPLPLPGFDLEALGVDALGKDKKGLDAASLEVLLRDGRRLVRENAARALGVLGAAPAELGLLTKDGVAAVRLAAVEALASAGDAAAGCASALVGALADRERDVRAAARGALVALGGSKSKAAAAATWEALIDGLRVSPDVAVRMALPALVAIGAPVVPALLGALEHVSPFVRLNALGALVKLAREEATKDAVAKGRDRVEAALKEPLESIQRTAQLVLDRLDGKGPGIAVLDAVALPAGFDSEALEDKALAKAAKELDPAWLVGAMGDGREFVRENAARALGLGKAGDGAAAALARGLKDSHGAVRIAAATSLGALKAEADQAVPALAAALRGADAELGGAALEALAAFGDKAVVAELTGSHLVGREELVVESIGRAARAMAAAFVPALAKVAEDSGRNLVERENAVSILGDLGEQGRKAEKALLGLLSDMQGMLSVKAIQALAKGVGTPGPAICKALTEHLMNEPRPSMHYAVRDAVRVLKRQA